MSTHLAEKNIAPIAGSGLIGRIEQMRKITLRPVPDQGMDVLQKAIDTYGVDNQTYMLFEEMAELQHAICKYRRGQATTDEIVDELADVLIMMAQAELMYDCVGRVSPRVNYKLARLAARMGADT